MPAVALLVCWTCSRALLLWLLLGPQGWVLGDVTYFEHSLQAARSVGLGRTLVEYPLPGVGVVALPWVLVHAAGVPAGYTAAVVGFSVVADAVFMWLLARRRPWHGVRSRAGAWVWVAAVPALGVTSYARFDLVPALLCALSLLLLARRPALAGVVAAVATGLKLWPAVTLPALVAGSARRRTAATSIVVVGAVLVAASVLVAGWARLLSPLTWQAARGLQVESVVATPAVVAWLRAPDEYAVAYGEHHSYEVFGPGVGELLVAGRVGTALLLGVLLLLWARAFRAGRPLGAGAVGWLVLAALSGTVVTGPVLSPQYLLWMLAPAAAVVSVTGQPRLRLWAALLVLAAGATQVVFPWLYGDLTGGGGDATAAVTVLAARNVLLTTLAGWALVEAVRATGGRVSGAGRSPASRRGRAGTSHGASGAGTTTASGEVPAPR